MNGFGHVGVVLLLIALLILINGFFAAAEMAFVSLSESDQKKLKAKDSRQGRALGVVVKDSTRYLSTIQVAITFAGFLSSAFAGSELSESVVGLFQKMSIVIPESVAVILVTVVLSYVTLVFGELVPKRIAINHAAKFAMFSAPTVLIVMKLTRPFVYVLSKSTDLVMRLLGLRREKEETKLSESELREMIVRGHLHGLYGKHEKKMIESIFRYDDMKVSKIMTPRPDIIGINDTDPTDVMINQVIQSKYSRLPVFHQAPDHVVGVLLAKDLLAAMVHPDHDAIDLKRLLREPYFVYENTTINVVFKLMKTNRQHLAFVIDEFGGLEGIVTMEDIIEEIFGDIDDEHDKGERALQKVGEDTYLVDGLMTIDDLNHSLSLVIPIDDKRYQTIAGFMIDQMNEIPTSIPLDPVRVGDIDFYIEDLTKHRINQVRLVINKPKD